MARINLRDCDVILQDGLSGSAAINDMTPPVATDTSITIDLVVLNSTVTNKVPVGARVRVAGETDTEAVHVVTARTPANAGPTTSITISPALGPGTYLDNGVITVLPQQLEIKIGEGNITYSEADEFNYRLDRDQLDTVEQGADQPMEVSIDFVYEAITTGTSETMAPMDAIKRRRNASEWVSSSADLCEPYAIDVVVIHRPPCGTKQAERTIFPDFRSESREVDFGEATISVSGRCNAVEPLVARGDY